mgnify:FL=1
MTQILNVPMPADKAMKIIRSIYESNSMIRMSITGTARSRYRAEEVTEEFEIASTDSLDRIQFIGDMTINYISPIIPTYSVWDQVMRLATGEIGEVEEILDERLQNESNLRVYGIKLQDDIMLKRVHRSGICKIA